MGSQKRKAWRLFKMTRFRTVFGLTLLTAFAIVAAMIIALPDPVSAAGGNGVGKRCGGFAGIKCAGHLVCLDDPSDGCEPRLGHTDCVGICRPPQQSSAQGEASIELDLLDLAEPDQCDANSEAVAAGPGKRCKPCKKDRRFCKCTHNGMPRASCDPCCYTNDIGILVCLD